MSFHTWIPPWLNRLRFRFLRLRYVILLYLKPYSTNSIGVGTKISFLKSLGGHCGNNLWGQCVIIKSYGVKLQITKVCTIETFLSFPNFLYTAIS